MTARELEMCVRIKSFGVTAKQHTLASNKQRSWKILTDEPFELPHSTIL